MDKTTKTYAGIMFASWLGRAITFVPFTLFFLGKGLDIFEVGLLNSLTFVMLFAFQLPTGRFADRHGRKNAVALSFGLMGVSFASLVYAQTFWQCLLASSVGALGIAFSDGALQAWLYDQLLSQNRLDLCGQAFSKGAQAFFAASIVGSLIGSRLMSVNENLPWFVAGFVLLLVGAAALILMKEAPISLEKKPTIKESIACAKGSRILQYAFVLALLQCFATQAPDYQWQPYYVSIGLDNIGLGYLLAGCFAAGFAGSFIVERLKIDGRNPKTFPAIQLLLGGAIITAVGISNLIIAVPALLLQELVRGMFIPIQHSYVQSNIPSNNRHQAAMVSSLDSMSANFGALVGLFASGWIAKTFSIPTAWKFTGAIVIIGTIAAYFFKKQGG